MTFRPKVVMVSPLSKFAWLGSMPGAMTTAPRSRGWRSRSHPRPARQPPACGCGPPPALPPPAPLTAGLVHGEHAFEILPRPDGAPGVRFRQSEEFTGCAAGLFAWINGDGPRKGFELMNNEIKARAERSAAAGTAPP